MNSNPKKVNMIASIKTVLSLPVTESFSTEAVKGHLVTFHMVMH